MITPNSIKRPDRFSQSPGRVDLLLRNLSGPDLNLNKNAVALERHGVEVNRRILLSRQQARFEEPLAIKSTHTDVQEDVLRSFVSHRAGL
jgi:hypothetical protein